MIEIHFFNYAKKSIDTDKYLKKNKINEILKNNFEFRHVFFTYYLLPQTI